MFEVGCDVKHVPTQTLLGTGSNTNFQPWSELNHRNARHHALVACVVPAHARRTGTVHGFKWTLETAQVTFSEEVFLSSCCLRAGRCTWSWRKSTMRGQHRSGSWGLPGVRQRMELTVSIVIIGCTRCCPFCFQFFLVVRCQLGAVNVRWCLVCLGTVPS